MQTNSTKRTFSQSFWSNPVASLLQNEVEMIKDKPVKVNKVGWVLLAMIFGCCGCDRCYMGQIMLGCLKCFTFGGCFIWHFIDYFVAVFSALTKAKDIKMVGYNHVFEGDSIGGAFWVCLVMFLIQAIQQFNSYQAMKMQQQQQKAMFDAMSEAQAAADTNRKPAAEGQPAAQPEAPTNDIPTSHQSLGFIPTVLTRNLRSAGLVPEKPTIPELIAAFEKLDKNGDGQLDPEEIKVGLKAMGATDESVEEMIKIADTDGDGQISKQEFLIAWSKKTEN